MMTTEPKMYISAELSYRFKQQVLKECESRTYEIGYYIQINSLLTPLSFDV